MIEQRARAGAEELRTRITSDVDAGLADLHVRHARTRRRTGLLAAAAVVLAAGLGAGIGTALTRSQNDRGPAPTHPGTSTNLGDPVCIAAGVDCLGDRTYRFDLSRPVLWALPPGFGAASGGGVSSLMVESYREASPVAGVTVMERVRASRPDGVGPAPGIGNSPRAFVEWLAGQPYLDAGKVARTTIDGRPAWRVRVTPRPDAAPAHGRCNRYQCHLVTYQPGGATTGLSADMAAQYIALRLPGGGTTVVWSWIFSDDPRHLGTLQEAVHSITWPTD
jgi:hypothetical protein